MRIIMIKKYFIMLAALIIFCTVISLVYSQPLNENFRLIYDETGNDAGNKLAIDNSGNIYVTGLVGARISTAKYDAEGNIVWRKKFAGIAAEDNVAGIELDGQSNCYIGGYTEGAFGVFYFLFIKYNSATGDSVFVKVSQKQSQAFEFAKDSENNFYVAGDYLDLSVSNDYNFNIIKYNTSGNVVWSRVYEAGNSAAIRSVSTDLQGNVYFTGDVFSTSSFLCNTLKYNSDGEIQWTASANLFVGGPSPLGKDLISHDSQGNVYVAGYRFINNQFREDLVLLKYSPAGAFLWERRFSNEGRNEDIGSMLIDNNGDIVVSGSSYDPSNANDDLLTLKYNASGDLLWNKLLTRSQPHRFIPVVMKCDGSNNLYIAGGAGEGFIVKYSSTGDTLYTKYISGNVPDGSQGVNDLKLDAAGNIYVTGKIRTTSNNYDMFVIKYTQNTLPVSQISEIAADYSLSQNYPNPFNPVTKIKFNIPNSAGNEVIKLTVYNSLGMEINTLVNKKLGVGTYEFDFDSDGLSSGVYYYKLQAGNFSEVKKMMLIK
jgi:hypothetical protein